MVKQKTLLRVYSAEHDAGTRPGTGELWIEAWLYIFSSSLILLSLCFCSSLSSTYQHFSGNRKCGGCVNVSLFRTMSMCFVQKQWGDIKSLSRLLWKQQQNKYFQLIMLSKVDWKAEPLAAYRKNCQCYNMYAARFNQ